jgi:predicted NBD/HSP70 family sugar kinase
MRTGTNLTYTKEYNLRIVHEVIRVFGPISRAAIARQTELTVQTVSNLTKELLSLGLIYEAERRTGARGAPSTALALDPEGAYSVGLDFDRDHLTGVLVDLAGRVRQRIHLELDAPSPSDTLEQMVETVERLIASEGLARDRLWGLGVGIPGPMHRSEDREGYLVNPKALPGWHEIPLSSWLNERLGLPVFLENNGTAAAIGERWYGEGRHIKTFFYVYLGSGLGGGLIMNGEPYEGFTGNAGEIGYLPSTLPADAGSEDVPHVGLHFKLPRLYTMLRASGTEVLRPEDLSQPFCEKNPAVLEWLDVAADHLVGVVLGIEYVIDPDAVFFGGRLPDEIVQELMERVKRLVPQRRVTNPESAPRLLLATAGADAAALGVATLPIYNFFAPAPQRLMKQSRALATVGLSAPRHTVAF